jgi:hypothetical protein
LCRTQSGGVSWLVRRARLELVQEFLQGWHQGQG